jgi:hypothetical protein
VNFSRGRTRVPAMGCALLILSLAAAVAQGRLRVIVETDAGGDPDDEQSLVRFLLYCNEWDVEGIIANRAQARDRENLNPERTGLGIVRALLKAYGRCYPNLVRHDSRFPAPEQLWQHTVSGYEDSDEGVNRIVRAVDGPDPRPVWFMNWGTDHGSASSSLRRALDRMLRERGQAGYARFKGRIRLSSDDQFGDHTTRLDPPFALWVDTQRPPMDGKRWYHRFSALTSTAAGFDIERDIRTGHGPLGALYPTNTTHWGKEGDSMMFLYLVPTGMNDPDEPTWGSWAGRYGLNPSYAGKPYYWANQADVWHGSTNRDNILARWAAHLQNDFRARLDWCVNDFAHANHPPKPVVSGEARRVVDSGSVIELDASGTRDPDGNDLRFEWFQYPGPGDAGANAVEIRDSHSARVSIRVPVADRPETLHVVLAVTDTGTPELTRYRRILITVMPKRPAP